jgi:hypothetical protein
VINQGNDTPKILDYDVGNRYPSQLYQEVNGDIPEEDKEGDSSAEKPAQGNIDFYGNNDDDQESVQVIEVEEIDDKDSMVNVQGNKDYIDNDFESEEKKLLKLNFENYFEAENIPVMSDNANAKDTPGFDPDQKGRSSPYFKAKTPDQPQQAIKPSDFIPISQLGKGSFGEVYLVQRGDEKLFAMKVLSKQKLLGNNYIKYALTERNVLSGSHHPFIVQLNYAFQSKNHLYMILEYCPGGDLGKLLIRKGKLSEEVSRIYIAEILLAIQYLHKKEIIFRDLKPDNIVIDHEGHCKLTDFGLSKEGIDDNISAQSFCGSLAYLAPEMLARQGHGKSVDWYLLGVLLYEMLVGKTPYFSRDKEQLLKNIENADLYFPKDLSNMAKLLILQLMDRDP